MTHNQVSWEMPSGLRSVRVLLDLIAESAANSGVRLRKYANWDSIGYYVDGQQYWIGIYFSDPEYLQFESCTAVDKSKTESYGIGTAEIFADGREGYFWRRWENLETEEVHFFSRSPASQRRWVETFLLECLEIVRKIELRPPTTPTSQKRTKLGKSTTLDPMIPVDIGGGD